MSCFFFFSHRCPTVGFFVIKHFTDARISRLRLTHLQTCSHMIPVNRLIWVNVRKFSMIVNWHLLGKGNKTLFWKGDEMRRKSSVPKDEMCLNRKKREKKRILNNNTIMFNLPISHLFDSSTIFLRITWVTFVSWVSYFLWNYGIAHKNVGHS